MLVSLLTKGIRRLSQLEIDTDKDWQAKAVSNLKAVAEAVAHGDIVFRGASVLEKLSADAGMGTDTKAVGFACGITSWLHNGKGLRVVSIVEAM